MSIFPSSSLLLADTHVHVYDCFDVSTLLDAAFENFLGEAKRCNAAESFIGVLFLSESEGYDWFGATLSKSGGRFGAWSVIAIPDEPCLLKASREPDRELYIVAGRQIVSAERLEVLALMTGKAIPDGQELTTLLPQLESDGALAILPWGVGKWIGGRGKIVSCLFDQLDQFTFLLGDNSGRPLGWPEPSQFHLASDNGINILRGSDPLPLPGEEKQVGSFGMGLWLDQPLSSIADLKTNLCSANSQLFPFGCLEKPLRFVKNQIALRVKK